MAKAMKRASAAPKALKTKSIARVTTVTLKNGMKDLGAVDAPLVVETGGRWHSSVPGLARALARDLVTRLPGFATEDMGTVVAWWGARLSAILLRGNARAYEALGCPAEPSGDVADHMPRGPLPHGVPEGGSVYELLVPPGAW